MTVHLRSMTTRIRPRQTRAARVKRAFSDAAPPAPTWRQALPAVSAVAGLAALVFFARRRLFGALALAADAIEEVADTIEDAAEDLGDAARARAGGDSDGD